MAASNINRVTITGNLTRDPELRTTQSGFNICSLRVACNGRRKDQSGNWVDKPNYFDVTVFGAQGENCANYLSKGRPVAIDGRLEWSEWEAKDGSGKRQKVEIIADTVQFLGSRDDAGGGGGYGGGGGGNQQPQRTDDDGFPPADIPEPAGVGSGGGEDGDIPF
jgi:single-strand DNA-binding protein